MWSSRLLCGLFLLLAPPAVAVEAPIYTWVSVGPVSVVDVADIAVHPMDPGVWALVTARGAVWMTPDSGAEWRRVPTTSDRLEAQLEDLDAAVQDAEAEPDVLDAVWLSRRAQAAWPVRLWFSSDGLLVVEAANVAPGADSTGQCAAVAADWSAFSAATCRVAVVRGDLRLVGSELGLHSMRAASDRAQTPIAHWAPLSSLVSGALSRAGVAPEPGRRTGSALLPQVSAELVVRNGDTLRWSLAPSRSRDLAPQWTALLALTWRPPRAGEVQVFVVNEEVVVDDGGTPGVVASQVRRGATVYRAELAQQVTQLSRTRVLLAGMLSQEQSLRRRVSTRLHIAEVEARLDALTDGAVSAWRARVAP